MVSPNNNNYQIQTKNIFAEHNLKGYSSHLLNLLVFSNSSSVNIVCGGKKQHMNRPNILA